MAEESKPLTVKQMALGDLEQELASTRKILERMPAEQFGWKPHAKSMSLGELATHTSNLLQWIVMTIKFDEFDFAKPSPSPEVPATTADLLAVYDQNAAAAREAVAAADETLLNRPWTLRNGEMVFFTQPTGSVLRSFCISHMVHHRGQLSVYLRLLDIPVPPTYGPTADEASF